MSRRVCGAWCSAAALFLTLALATSASGQTQTRDGDRTFGASYDDLNPEQRTLVDGLFQRAGAILGSTLDPRQRYNNAPLSSRTTFDAVTHALLRSVLTDRDSREPLGRTFELIDLVEAVRGQIDGTPGDHQFRLYVTLKTGARAKLDRADEFHRSGDNSFFHAGYPLSYRQEGFPSIQISMSPDATKADIDVDYRSPRFPISLVNGHFTAGNSDVRASNLERHNGRWSGLVNWWDGLIMPLFAADADLPPDTPRAFPMVPRAGAKTIDVAIGDFLTSWLVEGKPNLAVAYVDKAAFDCLAARLELEGQTLDRQLAPLQMYVRMKTISDSVGPVQSLSGTTTGVRLVDPGLKIVRHKRPDVYSLYAVPASVADKWSCEAGQAFGAVPTGRTTATRESYRTFYSTFTIRGPKYATAAVGLLWRQIDGQWKIVSYQTVWADANGTRPIPDLRKPSTPFPPDRMTAVPALSPSVERFLDAWLIRRNYDEALALVSPDAYPCVNLYLDPGNTPKKTAAEQLDRLRVGLERVTATTGSTRRLQDIVEPVIPADSRLRPVDHPNKAFGLVGIPDWMGPTISCEARLARGDTSTTEDGANQRYGTYFISAVRFVSAARQGAVLALAWARDEGGWRIRSFKIIEP